MQTYRRGRRQLHFTFQVSTSEFRVLITAFKYLCKTTGYSQADIVLKDLI